MMAPERVELRDLGWLAIALVLYGISALGK
jgi:hypothetical protein